VLVATVINPLPISLSISASGNNVCAGTLITYTAAPTNGGITPAYQWKVNGAAAGTNNPVFIYAPVNGDLVSCILTSSELCTSNNPAASNTITMVVNPILPVSVSITTPTTTICAGTQVTFLATAQHGGTSPSFQWKVNGTNAGANNQSYSFIPLNGDVVSCVLTSNAVCPIGNPATSNSLTMTVNTNLPVSISISTPTNPFCQGNPVTFTATPGNGGTLPAYQWKVNGVNAGTGTSTYTYNPVNGDQVSCVLTSNLGCTQNNPASSGNIIMSSLTAPSVSFTLCFDSITTVGASPFILKGGIPLGGTYSGPGVDPLTGVFTPSSTGVGTKTITYSYTNVSSCSALMTKNIIVQAAPVFNCGSNLTDIRDNKVYPTVRIGAQCWMQKNLDYGTSIQGNTGQTDNCINEKYCYGDNPANCNLYGGLYQWDELMAYTNSLAAQGLCPPGWHVPTQSDWLTLFNSSLGQGLAAKPLQDSVFNGFRAIAGGFEYSNFTWKYQGFASIYWTSNPYGSIKALSHSMNQVNFSVADYYSNRSNAFAVRCLKD